MCKNLDSPHPLTPSPIFGRGAGGEGKDLSLHWDAPSLQVNEVQNAGLQIRCKQFLPPVSKPVALYFMQKKPAVTNNS